MHLNVGVVDCRVRHSARLLRALLWIVTIPWWLGAATAATPPLPGPADIEGIWQPMQQLEHLTPIDGKPIPFTPAGLTTYRKLQAQRAGNAALDSTQASCAPLGLTRTLAAPHPLDILVAADQVLVVYEVDRAFQIVLMRTEHNDPGIWDPSYMGDGIGHWDGAILVIDSRNFVADIWLDDSGLPHSDELHVVERLRALKGGRQLEALVTIEDSRVFSRAWTTRFLLQRRNDIRLATDWVCGEAHRTVRVDKDLAAAKDVRAGRTATGGEPVEHADLTGFWREDQASARGAAQSGRPATPPGGPATLVRAAAMGHLQPWVQQRFDAFNAERAKGFEVRTRGIACLPWALPGIGLPGGATYVMDVVVTSKQVAFLYQLDHQSHIVYLDAEHPRNLAASDFGDSVGHWEGDTLVVDSIGFNDRTDVYYGIAHTQALHIVERLRLVDGYLENRVTFDDPGAFTTPFSYVQAFLRTDPMQEYVCAQNNVDGDGPLPPAAH